MAKSVVIGKPLLKSLFLVSAFDISMEIDAWMPGRRPFVVLSDDPQIENINFGPFARFSSTRGLLAAFEAAGKISSASEATLEITNNGITLPPEPEGRDQIVL